MKTPDHDYELHLGSTAKPGIQKLQHSARHLGALSRRIPLFLRIPKSFRVPLSLRKIEAGQVK